MDEGAHEVPVWWVDVHPPIHRPNRSFLSHDSRGTVLEGDEMVIGCWRQVSRFAAVQHSWSYETVLSREFERTAASASRVHCLLSTWEGWRSMDLLDSIALHPASF